MRNWNEISSTRCSHLSTVFSLPMRNWNKVPAYIIGGLGLFSAYLWGIETLPGTAWNKNVCWFSAYLWGIETSTRGRSFSSAHRFQPTYEELKPPPSSSISAHFFVFSLPMRNWNPFSRFLSPVRAAVFSLPMRNWNSVITIHTCGAGRSFQPTYEELKQF